MEGQSQPDVDNCWLDPSENSEEQKTLVMTFNYLRSELNCEADVVNEAMEIPEVFGLEDRFVAFTYVFSFIHFFYFSPFYSLLFIHFFFIHSFLYSMVSKMSGASLMYEAVSETSESGRPQYRLTSHGINSLFSCKTIKWISKLRLLVAQKCPKLDSFVDHI